MQNQKKKEDEINISSMKTNQHVAVSNQYQTVIFKPKLAKWYSDTQTVIFQWNLHNSKTNLDYFCL